MYHHLNDPMTFGVGRRPTAVVTATGFAEADYAMVYAKNLFKRLRGYPAEDRHDRGHRIAGRGRMAGREVERAMAYAKDLFRRLTGYPAENSHDHGHRLAMVARMGGTGVDPAVAYAKDLFKRLRGLPAPGPLGSKIAPTRGTDASPIDTSPSLAYAIGRAVAGVARLIQRSVLEPYVRKRRRRIAIAQLRALDDRLLADIGLLRGEIAPAVAGMLARRDDISSPPVTWPLPAAERRYELPLAA